MVQKNFLYFFFHFNFDFKGEKKEKKLGKDDIQKKVFQRIALSF